MKLTKLEKYYLADVIWYLKGYIAAKLEDDPNDFGEKHLEVLTKVMNETETEEEK